MTVLRQPGGLRDDDLVDHLPDLFRRADGADKGIVQHGQFQQVEIARNRGVHRHALYVDRGRAGRCTGLWQRDAGHHVDAEAVDEAWRFDNGVLGYVGDRAVVTDIEMPAIDTAGLQRLEDVAGV